MRPYVKKGWFRRVGILTAFFLTGCSGDTVVLPAPRFAQVGELRADVQMPLGTTGRLEGTIVWQSNGQWSLVERVYYRERLGGEVSRTSSSNLRDLSAAYASLVQQLNDSPGLRLTGGQIPPLAGSCAPDLTRVRFSMVDRFRTEIQTWDRCARGNLFTITPGSAGPDAEAARIVTAVQLIRSFTIGDLERSVFQGTLPFAALRQGAGGAFIPTTSTVFASDDGNPPPDWLAFWRSYTTSAEPEPEVRWADDMVLLLVDGDRAEAGHQLRVRRVLPVGALTLIEAVEGIPGDFCAPAYVTQRPYQIVKMPRVSTPIQFGQPLPLRVPCGQ